MYELVLITRDEKPEQLDAVKSLVTTNEGSIKEERKWGKKRFAYPINKVSTGFYQTWMVSMGAQNVAPFKRKLDLDENVLRYLFIKK